MVHAGEKLYFSGGARADSTPAGSELYSGMADARSSAWQFGDKLYIIDGRGALRCLTAQAAAPVGDDAKIPLFTLPRRPRAAARSMRS